MPRNYSARIGNSGNRRFKNGYGGGSGNAKFSPSVIFSGTDRLKDAERVRTLDIKLVNNADTLDTTSGLTDQSNHDYAIKSLSMATSSDASLRLVAIEPIHFETQSHTSEADKYGCKGLRAYVKHVSADLSICATTGSGNGDPVEISLDLLRVRGSDNGLTNSGVSIHSYDKDHTGSKAVFKLLSKRLVIQANQPPVKIKFFKNINSVARQESETSSSVDIDGHRDRYMLVMKFLKHTTDSSNIAVLNVIGSVSTKWYEM